MPQITHIAPKSSALRLVREPATPKRYVSRERLEVFDLAAAFADPLGERLGRQHVLVALAAELLDRDVARGVDLGPRDHPRRPVLVPDPDVLHADVEEGVARLWHVLEVELVAQVRGVLGEDAVPEQREDRAVLLLETKLGLGFELVELVEVAHERDCIAVRASRTVPFPGISTPGASSASGPRTKLRSSSRGCGTVSPGSSIVALPKRSRSRSIVRGPHRGPVRTRPSCRSTSSSSSRNARAGSGVTTSAAAFRKRGWSSTPHGSVSTTGERRRAPISPAADRIRPSRSPRFEPRPT